MPIARSRSLPFVKGLVALVLLSLLAGCGDDPPTSPDVPGARFHVSEARFGDGNPDLFFAQPLAATPGVDDPEFDEGGANEILVPYVRVCETDGAPSAAGCTQDVTQSVTGSPTGLPMSFSSGSGLYKANWHTDALDPDEDYRIEIWGLAITDGQQDDADPRWLFGWRDIRDSPSTASCDGTEDFCLVNYGQTLPVKVRIEDFVFCPVDRNCAVQFVEAGTDANLEASLDGGVASSARIFIPGQAGTDFALAFEPCTSGEEAQVDGATALPTYGPCLQTVTPPEVIELGEPAVVSLCTIGPAERSQIEDQLADPDQFEELKVHHFSTDGVPAGPITHVEAWPEASASCESEPTSGGLARAGSPHGLLELARAAGGSLLSLVRPRPLRALHLGGGGEGFRINSFFKLALPARFEYETVGDDFRIAPVGSEVDLRALVTDLEGRPVKDARVRWSVDSSPAPDATVNATPILTGADGISETTVTLSGTGGDNVFHAAGDGIADDRESGCVLPTTGQDWRCNGPRGIFDPFQPAAIAVNDGVEVIPTGTRLPFTVFGCEPGRGTPDDVDGILGEGEWECAESTGFPVNLSGGSTVQATLYWMSDDTHLHLAVEVPGSDRQNALRIEWDNDGDGDAANPVQVGSSYAGDREPGDDIWEFEPDKNGGGGTSADGFIDEKCSDSSQTSCGEGDLDFGGGNQTVAAFDNTREDVTVYEMSHPLGTGDTCDNPHPKKGCGALSGEPIDLDASVGQRRGFWLTLRLGAGAQGNTQWPGFLEYLNVEIR